VQRDRVDPHKGRGGLASRGDLGQLVAYVRHGLTREYNARGRGNGGR
jgi:hypothetical protein